MACVAAVPPCLLRTCCLAFCKFALPAGAANTADCGSGARMEFLGAGYCCWFGQASVAAQPEAGGRRHFRKGRRRGRGSGKFRKEGRGHESKVAMKAEEKDRGKQGLKPQVQGWIRHPKDTCESRTSVTSSPCHWSGRCKGVRLNPTGQADPTWLETVA